jgi:hypothetical protein
MLHSEVRGKIIKAFYKVINYLKATKIEVGLLLNFGRKAEFKRKIFSEKNN